MNLSDQEYSNDELIVEALKLIKAGCSEEEAQKKFNLSVADLDLIDYVVNEL